MSSEEKNLLMRIAYRVRQFWYVLRSSAPAEDELEQAKSVLSEPQMALFLQLHPSEQRHGLRMLQFLRNQGESLPDLLAAALLHDIGKLIHPLQLWERVLIVMARKLVPNKVVTWGDREPKGWKRPFIISRKHPEWGAELVSQTGGSTLLLNLIRRHENGLPDEQQNSLEARLLKALREADDWN